MKSSFCIDLQRFMLIPTKFPLSRKCTHEPYKYIRFKDTEVSEFICLFMDSQNQI